VQQPEPVLAQSNNTVQFKIEYHCPEEYTPYTPPIWPKNVQAPPSMPIPLTGMIFLVTPLNAPVPPV
jgi:hypothetical protein